MDQHKILPVPETLRISLDRSDGSHPIGSSRGGNSPKHGPVERKPSADPRPEGSWLYPVTIPGSAFQGIETYSTGGGYTEADQLSFNPLAVASAGHGAWQMTGQRT